LLSQTQTRRVRAQEERRFGNDPAHQRAAIEPARACGVPLGRIDFSDIWDLSPPQLNAMRRVGRSPPGDELRKLIAIRLDAGGLTSAE